MKPNSRAEVLKERYYNELRPNLLAHEDRHDLTLQLWLESYWWFSHDGRGTTGRWLPPP